MEAEELLGQEALKQARRHCVKMRGTVGHCWRLGKLWGGRRLFSNVEVTVEGARRHCGTLWEVRGTMGGAGGSSAGWGRALWDTVGGWGTIRG